MSQTLAGRTAIVTGGSRGIGLAVARTLLDRGARVCLTGRNPETLRDARDTLGRDGVIVVAGKTDDPAHRSAVLERVVDELGAPDILVNNAAVNPTMGPLVDLDPRAAEKIWSANLLACLGWVTEFCSELAENTPAAVINISSFAALRPSPAIGMYGISKSAILQLTRELALELAPQVRVNAVVPALIQTDFAAKLYEGREHTLADNYPMRRLGRPEDVANAVAFLASMEASWITGASLVIDGGLSLTGGIE